VLVALAGLPYTTRLLPTRLQYCTACLDWLLMGSSGGHWAEGHVWVEDSEQTPCVLDIALLPMTSQPFFWPLVWCTTPPPPLTPAPPQMHTSTDSPTDQTIHPMHTPTTHFHHLPTPLFPCRQAGTRLTLTPDTHPAKPVTHNHPMLPLPSGCYAACCL
jgi:hypothetical protein